MDVVDGDDAGQCHDPGPNRRDRRVQRCAFEQHVGRFADDPNDADQDDDRHEERQQRVDPRDARPKHDQTADDDGKGA